MIWAVFTSLLQKKPLKGAIRSLELIRVNFSKQGQYQSDHAFDVKQSHTCAASLENQRFVYMRK